MDTEVKTSIQATDKEAQYDASAKRLLGQKIILAHILVKTVDEFKGMNPQKLFLSLRENLILVRFRSNWDLPIRVIKKMGRE